MDPQAWARQQAALQRQTLHIQHQATVQTLQDAFETAQKPEMSITINNRRVDQAIPVYPRRGDDAMRSGEPAQVAIDRTQAEHLRHAQDANLNSKDWFKFVLQRNIPGVPTPVLSTMTLSRAEAAVMLAQGHLTETDIQRAGVDPESIRSLQNNARGLTVTPEHRTPQAGEVGDPNAPSVLPNHTRPTGAGNDLPQAPGGVGTQNVWVNDPPEGIAGLNTPAARPANDPTLAPQLMRAEITTARDITEALGLPESRMGEVGPVENFPEDKFDREDLIELEIGELYVQPTMIDGKPAVEVMRSDILRDIIDTTSSEALVQSKEPVIQLIPGDNPINEATLSGLQSTNSTQAIPRFVITTNDEGQLVINIYDGGVGDQS